MIRSSAGVRVLVRAVGAALAVALLSGGPAHAIGSNPPGPGGPPPNGGQDDSGSTVVQQVRNCSVLSSPAFMGVNCASGSSAEVIVKKVLGDDPVPTCWHDALTAEELAAIGRVNDAETTWYWEWCVTGIKKEPNQFDPEFTVSLIAIGPGESVVTLTANQSELVEIAQNQGVIPYPIAIVSPTDHPRVGGWVSYFNGTDAEVVVSTLGVVLRARVESLKVEPYGENLGQAETCPGNGFAAKRGDTPATHAGCWVKYDRSSSDEPGNKFPVWITARWAVDLSQDGGNTWVRFNTFSKSQATLVPVTEIQTLVTN